MTQNAVWEPQPRQVAFMQRPEYEALYGGAAGGGKSDALLVEALRQVHIPHYRALILRKTMPQARELIDRSTQIYPAAYPKAKYNGTTHAWKFPSGAQIIFGSMQHSEDKIKFQGQHFDFVAFDELTHFTWDEYSYLFSRNRPSGPGTRVYIRAATNPGGVGHGWVRDRFVTAAPPMTPIPYEAKIQDDKGRTLIVRRKRIFIPATVFDNKKLLSNDPNYLANLAMLPEAERAALLNGDWNSFSGQVFREWTDDPAHYQDRKWTHVVAPFEVPPHWIRYRGFDFGFAKPFSVGWYAVDTQGTIYRIAEYYGCTGEPNTGIKINPAEIAAQIRRIEADDPNLRGQSIIGIADPSIFDASRGDSVADTMAAAPNFVTWDAGDNHRISGKMQCHYRLAFDDGGRPKFQVFASCKHFIRTVPTLVYSQTHVEDVDTDGEDHIYDEWRYVMMSRPITPPTPAKERTWQDDPLDLRTRQYDPYALYRR